MNLATNNSNEDYREAESETPPYDPLIVINVAGDAAPHPEYSRWKRQPENMELHQLPSPKEKHHELLSRLRNLEAMVSELGSQVEDAAVTTSEGDSPVGAVLATDYTVGSSIATGSTEPSLQSEDSRELGGLVKENNGDLIVGDRFWAVFCNEVERIFESARGPVPSEWESQYHTPSNSNPSPQEPGHVNYYRFLLRQADAAAEYDALYPPPPQLLFLWQTFVDDIDPFIKLLHIPSMTRLIRDLRGHYGSVGAGTEALIFAICFAAVLILSEQDIVLNFNTSKELLMARYRLGTEQALEKAGLLTTTDLAVIQSLAIYTNVLLIDGQKDPAWALVGILIRIAVRLKLHQDGSNSPGQAILETETRRRLWYQICLVDSRVGGIKVSEFLISERMFNTKMPSNLDDADINPKTISMPTLWDRRTDTTISLILCEMWQFCRQIQLSGGQSNMFASKENLKLFEKAKDKIHSKYLKLLRSDVPLDCFANTMTLLFFDKTHLLFIFGDTRHTGRDLPRYDDRVLDHLVSIIELTYALQNEPDWRPWRWHLEAQPPPHNILKTLLHCLSARPWNLRSERGWLSATRFFTSIPTDAPVYKSLSELMERTQSCRVTLTPDLPSQPNQQETSRLACQGEIEDASCGPARSSLQPYGYMDYPPPLDSGPTDLSAPPLLIHETTNINLTDDQGWQSGPQNGTAGHPSSATIHLSTLAHEDSSTVTDTNNPDAWMEWQSWDDFMAEMLPRELGGISDP
ncbi:hypothetical protein DRE_06722 [Drechslerella stenobrocha 248]|uniref:Xylanolytic transcriptional activator regulatory domain-containing protein n=1 Tax=Drechslerella stenobrocha 248 TaxID=1043628 RepID=W7I6S4_9PEZI|nr:hypothetical protein DRE_06722 [Drechslerella stenobrocha 248]